MSIKISMVSFLAIIFILPKTTMCQWYYAPILLQSRLNHEAATGNDGMVYLFGGTTNLNAVASGEKIDPLILSNWTNATNMNNARTKFSLIFGQDGYIYAIGGLQGNNSISSVERFDCITQTWQTMASLNQARSNCAAAVGPDGKIYVIGGYDSPSGTNNLSSVERFDPPTNLFPLGQWNYVSPLPVSMAGHNAITGIDGNIYVFEGQSGNKAYKFNSLNWVYLGNCNYNYGGIDVESAPNGEVFHISYDGNQINGSNKTSKSMISNVLLPSQDYDLLNFRRSKGAITIAEGRIFVTGVENKFDFNSKVEKSNTIQSIDHNTSYCALWRFDDANGPQAIDSKSSNNGNAINNPIHNVSGRISKSIVLNGLNQNITVNNSNNLNFGLNTNFTIEGWLKWDNSSNQAITTIIDKRKQFGNKYQGYSVYITKTGYLGIQLANGQSYSNYTSNKFNITSQKWNHFAITVTRNGKIKIYINSALDSEYTPLSGNISNNAKLFIGKHAFSNVYYKGELDELAIYKKALNWAEIRAIFLAGSAGKQ